MQRCPPPLGRVTAAADGNVVAPPKTLHLFSSLLLAKTRPCPARAVSATGFRFKRSRPHRVSSLYTKFDEFWGTRVMVLSPGGSPRSITRACVQDTTRPYDNRFHNRLRSCIVSRARVKRDDFEADEGPGLAYLMSVYEFAPTLTC